MPVIHIFECPENIAEAGHSGILLISTNERDSDRLERIAIRECSIAYTCHAVGDGNQGERFAIRERIVIYVIAISDSNTLQRLGYLIILYSENVAEAGISGTVLIFANERNGDRLEKIAIIEGRIAYTRYAIGNRDRGKGGAT